MMSLPGVDVHKPDVRIPINGAAHDQAMKNIEAVEAGPTGTANM